jgi:hypothetical protein
MEARKLSLFSIFGALNPFMPFSRMKPLILSSCSADFAQMTNTSAIGALEIQVFEPFSTKPPSAFLAWVRMPAGSEPASGSVRPKQPIYSPVASLGKYFCFCSSEPKVLMGCITKEDCTDIMER